jgi:nucleoside-diphosphate-sugar epimerase
MQGCACVPRCRDALYGAARCIVEQVFVAGSTGNTGRRVVQQLRAAGYKVRAGVRVRTVLHQ